MSGTDPPSSVRSRSLSPSPQRSIRTATLVTTRSVVFSSSLYNSNATLSEDHSLPAARPVLTPPLTPMVWTHRRWPQPAEIALASAEEKDSAAAAEQSTVRYRRVTRSLSSKQTEAQQATPTTEEKETPMAAATHLSSHRTASAAASKLPASLPSSLPTTQPHSTAATSSAPSDPHTQRIHPSQLVPSYPFHRKSQPSALSTEAPPVSLRGLYNLAGITLFTLTARLVLENVLKYGWLIRMNMVYALSEDWDRTWPCLLIAFFVCCVSPVVSWAIERYGGEGEAWERWLGWVHALHIVAVFVVPQVIITVTHASIISGLVLVMVVMVMTMKLVSLAHVCHDIRHRIRLKREGKPTLPTAAPSPSAAANGTPYVQDVSALHPILPDHYDIELSHVLYFMLAPTLIYQLSYPKSNPTGHIRVVFLVRRVIELVFCLILQLLIIEQYLYPTVRNAMQSISGMHYLSILERILKIALPNGQPTHHTPLHVTTHTQYTSVQILTCVIAGLGLCVCPLCCAVGVVWLLLFYSLFHSWLNILAELMNFGDRLFYKEWWNCQTLDQYWNSWNLPVHNFVMRHLYAPLLRSGMSVWLAQLVSFLASAIAHELLVAVPLHTVKLYAFFGMLAQVPLIYFTRWIVRRFQQPVWSNCVFWLTFLVFGQPLLILLYAHAVLSRSAQMVEPHTVIVPNPPLQSLSMTG